MKTDSELKYVFDNINEWLKFSETKHAGLVVLNAGFIVGILSSYNNIQPYIYPAMILIGSLCFGLSIFSSLISQFPVTRNVFYNKRSISNPNLYFFGHLSQLEATTFVQECKNIDPSFSPNKLDLDLINQILVNARITQAKLTLFKFSSYVTAFGFGLISISTVIRITWHF